MKRNHGVICHTELTPPLTPQKEKKKKKEIQREVYYQVVFPAMPLHFASGFWAA